MGKQKLPVTPTPRRPSGCGSRTSAFPITRSVSRPAPLSTRGAMHTEAPLFGLGSGLVQQPAPEQQTHPSGGDGWSNVRLPAPGLPGEPPLALAQTPFFSSLRLTNLAPKRQLSIQFCFQALWAPNTPSLGPRVWRTHSTQGPHSSSFLTCVPMAGYNSGLKNSGVLSGPRS